jgi:hypothetical protein
VDRVLRDVRGDDVRGGRARRVQPRSAQPFASGTAWSDGVIWWEVATGLVLAPIAILLVRRGIRDLHEEVRTAHMAATRTR